MKKFFKTLNATVAATTLAASTILSSGVALAADPGPTNGASEAAGSLAATSSSQVQIGVTKENYVEISGMTDLAVDWAITSASGLDLTENFCVYAADSTGGNNEGSYSIGATGANADLSGNMRLLGIANSEYISYVLDFGTSPGTVSSTGMLSGATALNETNGHTTTEHCTDIMTYDANARIDIIITHANLVTATADTYEDTITFLVTAT